MITGVSFSRVMKDFGTSLAALDLDCNIRKVSVRVDVATSVREDVSAQAAFNLLKNEEHAFGQWVHDYQYSEGKQFYAAWRQRGKVFSLAPGELLDNLGRRANDWEYMIIIYFPKKSRREVHIRYVARRYAMRHLHKK